MRYAVREALEALDREYIDIFLMHEVRPGEDRTGAWQYLLEAKEAGLVKAIGISTHHIDVVEEYMNHEDMDVIFP
ncbi:aldo/keto reductase, partial [Acinetobacter pittii]|uniref:aldo/keto reductase n=1 Tax=Acinetobacter pittii TaxID=48296 RepID=UPI0028133D1F